jgi:hypothetical protein
MSPTRSPTEEKILISPRTEELTLLIAERVDRLAQQRGMPPGSELALWLEAEAQVKRELQEEMRRL